MNWSVVYAYISFMLGSLVLAYIVAELILTNLSFHVGVGSVPVQPVVSSTAEAHKGEGPPSS